MCFLSATHSFDGKNLYCELEIGGRYVTLLAIQTFVRKKVCRSTKHGQMTRKLFAIHGFMAKRVCRCMRNTPARLNDTTNRPTLLGIQTFVRKKVCRGTKHGQMTGKLFAIHSLMPKRVCRGREKSWEKRTATGKSRVLRSRSGSGRG